MMKLALSPAASGLLRALIARSGVGREDVILSNFRSVDWQSLTFIGERHEMTLRIIGPEAWAAALRMSENLSDTEFSIPGQLVADIALRHEPEQDADGSVILDIEALTLID